MPLGSLWTWEGLGSVLSPESAEGAELKLRLGQGGSRVSLRRRHGKWTEIGSSSVGFCCLLHSRTWLGLLESSFPGG